MKFNLIIDETKEPEVTVVCSKVTKTISEIERLCAAQQSDILYGYNDGEIVPLELADIDCFYTKDNKVFASCDKKTYLVKIRIKDVLEMVDDAFIKINQGAVVKVSSINRFEASIGGSLKVVLKNGQYDYVSRREVKNIKRRFGL